MPTGGNPRRIGRLCPATLRIEGLAGLLEQHGGLAEKPHTLARVTHRPGEVGTNLESGSLPRGSFPQQG
jgi:hypothetical protein